MLVPCRGTPARLGGVCQRCNYAGAPANREALLPTLRQLDLCRKTQEAGDALKSRRASSSLFPITTQVSEPSSVVGVATQAGPRWRRASLPAAGVLPGIQFETWKKSPYAKSGNSSPRSRSFRERLDAGTLKSCDRPISTLAAAAAMPVAGGDAAATDPFCSLAHTRARWTPSSPQ